jgi:hypothetical protein
MRRRVTSFTLTLALAISSAGCAEGDDAQHLRNADVGAAVRVPGPWTVFEQDQVQANSITPGLQIPSPVRWFVGVDADPQPSPDHIVQAYTADHPQGFFEVFELDENDRAQMSILAVRNMIVPIDQLRDDFLEEAVVVLGYDDRVEVDGMRGLEMVVQVQESEVAENGELQLIPGSYFQLNQVAWWDPKVERLHLGALMCSIDCYARNADDIEATMSSWIARAP